MTDMVLVATCDNRIEANIVKGFLQSRGIDAIILADDEGGMYPYPLQPTIRGVQVVVPKKQKEKAEQILKEKK